MLLEKTVAVVVPAYNEETQIGIVLDTMPDFVDRIVVVNDCSTDNTSAIVRQYIQAQDKSTVSIPHVPTEIAPTFFNRADLVLLEMRREEECLYVPHKIDNNSNDERIVLIDNLENGRVGGAIANGYKWCREHAIDCTAVMAGDAQMDPGELESICRPVLEEGIDYVKGNRLRHKTARRMIPKKRHFGNSILSALTKLSSGYWSVSDTQTGYTAISLAALEALDLHKIYRNYGMPNDMLIKLNIAHCTLREVPIKPVYAVGEQSKMKIKSIIPRVSWLLVKGFFVRICKKYLTNDFHPIFLFYFIAFACGVAALGFLIDIIVHLIMVGGASVTTGTYLGFIALLVTCLITLGFGMWLDVDDNEKLQR